MAKEDDDDNKDIVRRSFEDLWNKKDESIIDKLIDEDYVDHTVPLSFTAKELQGVDVFKHVFETLQSDFTAIQVSIGDQIEENDKVVTRVTWQCTLDPSATPDVVTVTGIVIDRIAADKIVESWDRFEVLYRLVGLLNRTDPLPGPTPPPVGCDPADPCPPGYVCMTGMCQHI